MKRHAAPYTPLVRPRVGAIDFAMPSRMPFPISRLRLASSFVALCCLAASAWGQPVLPKGGSERKPAGRALPARPITDLVVVAPHPDDETLFASGLMLRAKQQGQRVAVIVMTNGDFDCHVDGLTREQESVQGLAQLGISERDVYFMGYPDGHLSHLGRVPLKPVPRKVNGKCTRGAHTYGNRGNGRSDFHRERFGAHGVYTSAQAVSDLTTLLAELRPRRLAVTHPNDSHPDHAATYTLVRRALRHLSHKPELLRAFVHTGDCWPTGDAPQNQCLPGSIAPGLALPPLAGALSGYEPDVRIPVPEDCLNPVFQQNPKLRAIGSHRSQTHDDHSSYLFAFARAEEVFYSEVLKRQGNLGPVLVRGRLSSSHAKRAAAADASNSWMGDGYVLEVDSEPPGASLWRDTPQGRKELHRWPLPHDLLTHATEFEVRVEHVHGNDTAELGLYANRELIGVTVVVGSGLKSK